MNQIIGGGLFIAGTCGISLTAYVYVNNIRPAQADLMGADMMFDGMWLVAVLLLAIGTSLIFQLAWFWCVALAVLLHVLGSFFAKTIVSRIAQKSG